MEVEQERAKRGGSRFAKRGLETKANPDKRDLEKGFEVACLDAAAVDRGHQVDTHPTPRGVPSQRPSSVVSDGALNSGPA